MTVSAFLPPTHCQLFWGFLPSPLPSSQLIDHDLSLPIPLYLPGGLLQLSWTDTVPFSSRIHALSFAALVSNHRDPCPAHRKTQKESQPPLVWSLNENLFWDVHNKCQLQSTKQAPAHGDLYPPRVSQAGWVKLTITHSPTAFIWRLHEQFGISKFFVAAAKGLGNYLIISLLSEVSLHGLSNGRLLFRFCWTTTGFLNFL